MKLALAHDSFTQMGGAEKVFKDIHEVFPDAPVFTLVLDNKYKEKYKSWDIRTSVLQPFYNLHPKLQHWLAQIPWAIKSLDFSGFDVVLSSSSGFIKNITVPKNCIHINYCHTPTRFLWSDSEYVNQEVPSAIRWAIKPLLKRMKKWDYAGAQKVTHFIANSKEVQGRIQRYYQRTSTVIYPAVDTEFWKPTEPKKDYFLIVGRLQAHKRNDFIVEVFNELALSLHVVGTGRQEEYLRSIAKPNIKFLARISNEQLRDEYSGAKALIFPQTEDFGLVPLEAAACGTSTLAYGKGGALETIIPGKTGELFSTYDKEAVKKIIDSWDPVKYQPDVLRAQADKFNKENFKNNIKEYLKSHA